MAKKITPDIISKMIPLYEELGTYAAVAKELGISAASVSKHIKEQKSFKTYSSYAGPMPSENPPEKDLIIGFGSLSTAEKQSYDDFLKEYGYVF